MIYLLVISMLSLFISCNSKCSCKLGEANITIIQSVYSNFSEGNIDGVVAAMSENIEWNEAENYIYADKNPYVGSNAILEGVFGRIGAEWEYFNIVDKTFYPAGASNVLVTGRYQAKYRANNNELDAQFAHVWTVEDGKVTRFQQYTDTKQAADAIIISVEEEEE